VTTIGSGYSTIAYSEPLTHIEFIVVQPAPDKLAILSCSMQFRSRPGLIKAQRGAENKEERMCVL